MNKMRDVFIIGAGCSVPYGFPSGVELYNKLRKLKNKAIPSETPYLKNNILYKIYSDEINDLNLSEPIIESIYKSKAEPFFKSIDGSVMVSIDEFLKNKIGSNKSGVVDFGKRMLAHEILEAELMCGINRPDLRHEDYRYGLLYEIDWVQHLLSKIDQLYSYNDLDKKLNYIKSNKFIIFNYDRVFEKLLLNYLIHDLEVLESEAINFINELIDSECIVHVNGYIGKLDETPFGGHQPEERENYKQIAEKMKTVWEKLGENDRDSKKIIYVNTIKEARNVYFMGFSFLKQNLETIGITGSAIKPHSQCFCTAYGLSDTIRKTIASRLGLVSDKNIKNCTSKDLIIDYFEPKE